MISILENRLQINFSDDWQAIKFDEHGGWHRANFGHYSAVDILAYHKQYGHYWIEIKDIKGYEEDNLPRLSPSEPKEVTKVRKWLEQHELNNIVSVMRKKPFLIDEVITKIRDSLITVQLAQRLQESSLHPFFIAQEPLTIVLLLTWKTKEFKRLATRLTTKLERFSSTYRFKCLIVNQDFNNYPPGLTVRRIS